ncbi:TfoX/Sxy family protein [Pseudorhodoferax sp. Leaf267]|uniref:TfoX/Sxy family protein n=1 Tax=Pseudorhodoferax sp. Leaf267 TaxID=1736316 RepID=UPI0006F66471|nr:TfoX/Sxy family protein [Pseudorhodoferax sp. Leaf267]KQP23593.1 transcriptional regulator [Pseudorhodoferax sp. Leaf267]
MSEFSDNLHEVFERFGRIAVRRMFGGHGVFHEGRMFALVARERLYLKTDAQSVAAFEAKHLPAFEYERKGELARMHYHEAPAEIFEDRDEAARWARLAWEAVLRSGTPPRAPAAPRQRAAARKRSPKR